MSGVTVSFLDAAGLREGTCRTGTVPHSPIRSANDMNAGVHVVYRFMIHFAYGVALTALLRIGISHANCCNGGPISFRRQYEGKQL